MKAFKAIAGSKDRDLASLYTKIKEKEPDEFQEKQVLIYVASRVGSIYPSVDREGVEKKYGICKVTRITKEGEKE